jgi:hypothetical protein
MQISTACSARDMCNRIYCFGYKYGLHLLGLVYSLVEKGSLVQHPNVICPGSAGHWGPMTLIGPGSCRLEISPGSFRGIGPGLWH